MKGASTYARMGWRVIPLHSVGPDGACSCFKGVACGRSTAKHPRLNDWVSEASNEPEQIADWDDEFPNANVGVATGAASGFFVLDVDPENGGDDSLAALVEEYGELPTTAQARTASGGSHFLFKLPDFSVTNSASRIGEGLDIRGNGGQIVVAPSRTAKGSYQWVNAPWSTEIAEAPAWLIDHLGRTPKSATVQLNAVTSFPLATPEVIQLARTALDEFGPAIDGQGGGLKTVQAAAILTHDFALSDSEAWPLFLEWNTTCEPPWEEEDLKVRLQRGRKYGKAEYGCKRPSTIVERAEREIRDWETKGNNKDTMFDLIARVRNVMEACDDLAKREYVEVLLESSTGISRKSLGLPRVIVPIKIQQGEILVTTELFKCADESVKALHASGAVYQRANMLCEVVLGDDRTFIHDLSVARIQDLMTQCAHYVHVEEKGPVRRVAPISVATMLHSRRMHPLRILEAVTTAPIFLADGSILSTKGYNPEARVYLDPSVQVSVLDRPTQADAIDAVDLLRDLVCDFKFQEEADFTSWLASLLSPLVKSATRNAPSPLFIISASSAGAGKSMLADLVARIVTGREALSRSRTRDANEWLKKLTTFVREASPVGVLDNINGIMGEDQDLDRLVTSSIWSDRLLGASEAPPLPNVTTWFVTGRNTEPSGDTIRRSLMIRLVVDSERPQERKDFKRKDLPLFALEHRADYLTAALTILRAFHVAGRPAQSLPEWGSFTTWSSLVRGALVWAGCVDPFGTQQRISRDLTDQEDEAHDFWASIVANTPSGQAADLAAAANQADASAVLGLRESVTAFNVRKLLARFVEKPRRGQRIRRDGSRYWIEAVN